MANYFRNLLSHSVNKYTSHSRSPVESCPWPWRTYHMPLQDAAALLGPNSNRDFAISAHPELTSRQKKLTVSTCGL
jgi:hypothetical protein